MKISIEEEPKYTSEIPNGNHMVYDLAEDFWIVTVYNNKVTRGICIDPHTGSIVVLFDDFTDGPFEYYPIELVKGNVVFSNDAERK